MAKSKFETTFINLTNAAADDDDYDDDDDGALDADNCKSAQLPPGPMAAAAEAWIAAVTYHLNKAGTTVHIVHIVQCLAKRTCTTI